MKQIIWQNEEYEVMREYFHNKRRILLVCGKTFEKMRIKDFFSQVEKEEGITFFQFSDYQPNPEYESVVKGVKLFQKEQCDAIVAVGGGSAIDVAKCIKIFSNLDPEINYLEQDIKGCTVPLLVVPTTAGTGSESTRFAVIYYNGEKQSVSHEHCIPNAVFFDATVLEALPDYIKKSALLDAMCHGIESYWSINSTDESKNLSDKSLRMIFNNYSAYMKGKPESNLLMLQASNMAGRAINIAQTTGAHAMAYKLTKLYGISHGHAVAICLVQLWKFMLMHKDKCQDLRGKAYLEDVFLEIAASMGATRAEEAILKLEQLLCEWNMNFKINENDLNILVESVNVVRLANNPVFLSEKDIREIYLKLC